MEKLALSIIAQDGKLRKVSILTRTNIKLGSANVGRGARGK